MTFPASNYPHLFHEIWYHTVSSCRGRVQCRERETAMKSALNALLIVFIISVCSTVPAWAQTEKSDTVADRPSQEVSEKKKAQQETPVELNKEYFKGYVSDLKNIVTAPVRWDTTDWITAVAVAGVATGLYDNDAKIQKW